MNAFRSISLKIELFNDFYFSLNAGLVMSPDSHFYTTSYGFGLKYYVERNGVISNKNNYKEQLKPLSNKRVVFIFDECHRSQFGENHKHSKHLTQKQI